MKPLLCCLALLVSGCGAVLAFVTQFDPKNRHQMNSVYEHTRYTDYTVGSTQKTKDGISIDISEQTVDLVRVDSLTRELETCLGRSVERRAFVIKIAPDWRMQECAGRQLFPCSLPNFEPGCADRECPCGCAGILQWPNVVVTTPNLASLKHELIHLVTRQIDHQYPAFAQCQ